MSAGESTERTPPPRKRRWLRWLGLGLLALILIIAGIALWAWTQRYSLIERQVVTYLDSQGIEADLSIRSATRTAAEIRDIRLSYDGERFLAIDRLEAEYQWRDLLDGQVERLAFTGLDAVITVDERGQIVDGWRPPATGDAATLPPRGITVKRGAVRVRTPYGDVPLSGDATLRALDDLEFSGTLAPTVLNRNGAMLDVGGPLSAQREGAVLSLDAPELRLSLAHPRGQLERTVAAVSGDYDLQSRAATGQARLAGGSFRADAGVVGEILSLALDGTYAPETGLQAGVTPELRGIGLTDKTRRRDLARTLSLAGALGDVPVARNFVPQIAPVLDRLLGGSDISGRMRVDLGPDGRTIGLLAPLTLTAEGITLTLTPAPDAPLYRYPAGADTYRIDAVAALSRPLPLTLSPLSVSVRSPDGFTVGGVAAAKGRAVTRRDWRATRPDGQPARLGPIDVAFDYTNPEPAPARLTLRGAADYDGDVPGGIVTGLQAGGRLSAILREGRPRVDFTPNGPLRFAALETASDWGLRDFTGTLEPKSPLYARMGANVATVATGLREATFRAERQAEAEGGAASLDMRVGQAALSGTIRDSAQDWSVGFEAMTLASETFPVVGTDLALPSGQLEVALSQTDRTRFSLSAPDSTLLTPGYAVRGMAIAAEGTAERYELAYSGGRVRLIPAAGSDAVALPILPADGMLRFADGVFTGEATTVLPKAEKQPIAVDYRIVDGLGEASVRIRDLTFTPRGLQPQDLAPALRGKIAQVEGAVDGDLTIRFGGGQAPSGTGTLAMKNLSLGTAPGPVSGLSGTVELTSLFPIVTAPDQRLRIATFDPGFPLVDGEFVYGLVDGGVAISRAEWPLGEGRVAIDPFTWSYGADENRVTLRVSGVEVGEFLKDIGNGRLSATGELEGAIPVVVRGIDVLVEGGRLSVEDGGFIRYKGKEGIAERVPNRFAADALKALENFRYDSLFAEINGPLDGEIKLGMAFTGTNKEVLYGVPFAFDVSVEGQLFNIARSFNTNATIKSQVGAGLRVAE